MNIYMYVRIYIYVYLHTNIIDHFLSLRYLLHHAPKLGVRTHQPGRHHLVCTLFFLIGVQIVSAGIRMRLAMSMIGTHIQVSRCYPLCIALPLPTVCVRAPRWSLMVDRTRGRERTNFVEFCSVSRPRLAEMAIER